MRNRVILLALASAIFMNIEPGVLFGQEPQTGHGNPEPPMAGVHWAKGEKPDSPGNSANAPGQRGKPGGSANMSYHGGTIMVTTAVTPIFWGPRWSDPSFVADKMTGLATLYSDLNNSTFADTSNEYYQTGLVYRQVTSAITSSTAMVDLSPAVKNGNRTSLILSEVCKMITSPIANGYYPVYVDTRRGNAGFCAWHSAGSCGGVLVQFAFFFDLDGDVGCDPGNKVSQNSQGLAALANVSAHEISEARTDPHLDAWYDASGEENADKCAWTFGSDYVTLNNHSQWTLQGNWSNLAYNAGTGYANSKSQKGCLDGGNFK